MSGLESLDLTLLNTQPLTNAEIIELLAVICSMENIAPYIEHVNILRERYDMTMEMRRLEIEIMSMRDKFPLPALVNFFKAASDESFITMIMDMIDGYQADPAASLYIDNLATIFNFQYDEQMVKDIIRYIETTEVDGSGITSILNKMDNLLDKVAEFSPKPDYIKDYDIDVSKLPHLEEGPLSGQVPDDLIAIHILQEMGSYNLHLSQVEEDIPQDEEDDEYIKDKILKFLGQMDINHKADFIKLLNTDKQKLADIRNNRDIFRVFGPVNPYPDVDYSDLRNSAGEYDINVIYGGARMFTDLSLEYDYDNDLPVDTWFGGNCWYCRRRIRYMHWAVREPRLDGGWRGCFCTWKCVRLYIEDMFDGDPQNSVEDYQLLTTKLMLCHEYEMHMKDIGIADREFEEEEEVYDEFQTSPIDPYDVKEIALNITNVTETVQPALELPPI